MTEGQRLAQYRREGRDGEFQAHLVRRHAIICFHRLMQPWAVPLLDWFAASLDPSLRKR